MTYEKILKNLNGRGLFRIRPGLHRIRRVLKELGNPEERVPVIHIAGTNGKGSVSASLESVLRASGYRTGIYTSPHLMDVQERIQINGSPSKGSFVKAARAVLKAEAQVNVHLTYFELLTAIAFRVFAQAKIDIVILECGMGGKWDATNVITKPLVSIITSIGQDHVAYLGRSLQEIAYQKAGIIKAGRPVISGVLPPCRRVIQQESRKQHAPLLQLNKDFFVSSLPLISHIPFQTIRYRAKGAATEAVSFALLGKHQAANASLVLTALTELVKQGWKIPAHARHTGLRNVSWPGRFQVIPRDGFPTLVLDGAHNSQAMDAFLQSLQSSNLKTRLKTFIFSCFKDKDYRAMAASIRRVADEVCLCKLPGERAASPAELKSAFAKVEGPVRTFETYEKAYHAAIRDTPNDGIIVVTGSLMLVGQALEKLHLRPQLRPSHV